MLPSLDIIIVNWNAGVQLTECISSVKNAIDDNFEIMRIVIIDNASEDKSIEKINEERLPITILRNSINVGFAKACNQGASESKADFLLFLNPDTRLYNDSLSKPIMFLSQKENVNIGIVGLQLRNECDEISRNCARYPTPFRMIYMSLGLDKILPGIFFPHFMTEWDHLDSRVVDQVMGAFLMIRRNLFEDLQGYDERFFVYYEDADLSLRANRLGKKSYYLSDAFIYHKGGGTTEKVKAERLFYFLRSKLHYAKKHFSFFNFCLVFFATIFIEPFVRIFTAFLKSNSLYECTEIVKGYKKLIFSQ